MFRFVTCDSGVHSGVGHILASAPSINRVILRERRGQDLARAGGTGIVCEPLLPSACYREQFCGDIPVSRYSLQTPEFECGEDFAQKKRGTRISPMNTVTFRPTQAVFVTYNHGISIGRFLKYLEFDMPGV